MTPEALTDAAGSAAAEPRRRSRTGPPGRRRHRLRHTLSALLLWATALLFLSPILYAAAVSL